MDQLTIENILVDNHFGKMICDKMGNEKHDTQVYARRTFEGPSVARFRNTARSFL